MSLSDLIGLLFVGICDGSYLLAAFVLCVIGLIYHLKKDGIIK